MAYLPRATPHFNKIKKKLPKPLRAAIDKQVDLICETPTTGERKKGDLRQVWVHKFKFHNQRYLLAYLADDKAQAGTLLAIGSHENFYRDLKRYLRR